MFGSIFGQMDAGPVSGSGSVATDLAFGPPSTGAGMVHPLHPSHGFGLTFWLGVAGLAALAVVRHALPA